MKKENRFLYQLLDSYSQDLDFITINSGQIKVGFPGGTVVKNAPANERDSGEPGVILGLGRSPGGGNVNPLQYSCLGNPMERGAWWATAHGVAESWT